MIVMCLLVCETQYSYNFPLLRQIGQAYWLDEPDEAQSHDDITVTMQHKEIVKGLIIREFSVQKYNKVVGRVSDTVVSARAQSHVHVVCRSQRRR